jgi:DNA polymerase III gamma/tau subunit
MLSLDERPKKFDEMVGHKTTIKEMKKHSISMTFPEVMIFEGDSGTGKTTMAFIIAALLTSKTPIVNEDGTRDPDPTSGSFVDIYNERFARDVRFYDASSMGKDDILKLEEVLNTMPMYDGRKIIIIDEAQEVSKAGKGVFLKLLEKKRKNVTLILCTMNIDAFDKAIKHRAQVYKFKSIGTEDIAEYLFNLTKSVNLPESVPDSFYTEVLFAIADACEGSARLATQIFQRAIASEMWTEGEILKEFGLISQSSLADLIGKFATKNKSLVADLRNVDVKEIFLKMFKAFTDAKVYQLSGSSEASWKEETAKKVIATGNLDSLLDMCYAISKDTSGYFNQNIFMYHVSRYLSEPTYQSRVVARNPELGSASDHVAVREAVVQEAPVRAARVMEQPVKATRTLE